MPYNRSRSKVFYGWWVVAAAFFISLYVAGSINYGFTSLFEPIVSDLGWSYTQISFAFSLRGLEMGLLAPLLGILADRWGPRRLIFGGAIIAAGGLVLLSRAMSLGMFYGAFVVISIGVGCCTMTVLMTAVANWFRQRIGIASGIAVCGFGFSGVLVPVMVKLIEMYGWRQTLTILALGMLVVVLPLSLLIRHKPEQYGSLPDGRAGEPAAFNDKPSPPQQAIEEVKVKQALKSSSFLRMALAFTCHPLITSAIVTHVMPYLGSVGVSRVRASLVATAIPLISIGGRLGLGWLGDRVDRRWVSAGAITLIGLGMFCCGLAPTAGMWLIVPFIVFLGVGYGGTNALRVSMVREYFGRANFGTVFGFLTGINMLGVIVGPPLAGWVYDSWGSYQGIWFIFAGLPVAAIIAILTVPPVGTAAAKADKA